MDSLYPKNLQYSKFLENSLDDLSQQFWTGLHLVTPKGKFTSDSIIIFVENGEVEISVDRLSNN